MPGAVTENWLDAFRHMTVEPVVHCSIALTGTTMEFHNWTSGGLDSSITGDPLLSTVTAVSQTVDPVLRGVQFSELTLDCIDDGKMRSLVSTQSFFRKIVTVKLGTPSLDLDTDFIHIFKGFIKKLVPQEGGGVFIKLGTLA